MTEWALLAAAGVAAGLAATLAGLASLVSYPALLALGLPPVVANVTNTVAMVSVIPGAVLGSRTELRGRGRRVLRLCVGSGLGGATGAALLLLTPASTFAALAPLLIALGSATLLFRDRIRTWATERAVTEASSRRRLGPAAAVFGVGVYGGYFGAAAGIIMLAVLSVGYADAMPVTNAIKTVVTGAANLVAAITFTLSAPVDWTAASALAAGLLIGSWLGPQLARHLPERPLRYLIATAGLGLAAWLAYQ